MKQISIFIENSAGRLAEISKIISDAGIDIRAVSLADTTNFGVMRMVVDNPENAYAALAAKGLSVKLSDVTAVYIPDKVGALTDCLELLAANKFVIDYVYSALSLDGKAIIIMRVHTHADAEKLLKAKGYQVL